MEGSKAPFFGGMAIGMIITLTVMLIILDHVKCVSGVVDRVERHSIIVKEVRVKVDTLHQAPIPGDRVIISKLGDILFKDPEDKEE